MKRDKEDKTKSDRVGTGCFARFPRKTLPPPDALCATPPPVVLGSGARFPRLIPRGFTPPLGASGLSLCLFASVCPLAVTAPPSLGSGFALKPRFPALRGGVRRLKYPPKAQKKTGLYPVFPISNSGENLLPHFLKLLNTQRAIK